MKATIWKISGYKGFNDYDGPEDNNFSFNAVFDSRLTKEEVENFFFDRYGKRYRSVALKAELIEEQEVKLKQVDSDMSEEDEFWESLYDTAQAFIDMYVPNGEVCRNERTMNRNLPSVAVIIPVRNNRSKLNELGSTPCFRRIKDTLSDGRRIARCSIDFTEDGKLNMQR